jgi:hypothetical protein
MFAGRSNESARNSPLKFETFVRSLPLFRIRPHETIPRNVSRTSHARG